MSDVKTIGRGSLEPLPAFLGGKAYPITFAPDVVRSLAHSGIEARAIERAWKQVQQVKKSSGRKPRGNATSSSNADTGIVLTLPTKGGRQKRFKVTFVISGGKVVFQSLVPARPRLHTSSHSTPVTPELLRQKLEHEKYLEQMKSLDEQPISEEIASLGFKIWNKCLSQLGNSFIPPSAGATRDGRIIYTWDVAGSYLEAELIPSKPTEWYFRNEELGTSAYKETKGSTIPAFAIHALKTMAEARPHDEASSRA